MAVGLNLGVFSGPPPAPRPTGKCRLAILGDFTGRAGRLNPEAGAALAARKGIKVDCDNLDAVIKRLGVKLSLQLGGSSIDVPVASLDDLHPEQLFEHLPVFAELSVLRQRLKNRSTFAKAAADLQSWAGVSVAGPPEAPSRGATIPLGDALSDFEALLGEAPAPRPASPIQDFIKQIVGPHVVPSKDPREAALVASVDEALSSVMRGVLHHPDFQATEALWRSVDLLVRRLETDAHLQIVLFDISAEEFAGDLSREGGLEQSALYQLFVEQPSLDVDQGPFSAVVAAYTFARTRAHAELLGRAAQVTGLGQTAFVSAISSGVIDEKPDDLPPEIAQAWKDLRALPAAAYLALATPSYMLRRPYGEGSEPVDCFDFEEIPPGAGLRGFLWGNPAILVGLLIGQSFTSSGGKAAPGSVLSVGDLPFHYYEDKDGDQVAMPCTERLLTINAATALNQQGFLPLLGMKGSPEARLGSFNAVGGSPLAGPWAPVSVSVATGGATAPPPPAAPPEPAPPPAAEPPPEAEAPPLASDATGDADLDALLADLAPPADPAAPPPPETPAGALDPALEDLLKDLG